jgi:2-polyprenyl-3-methyl-5-hydroxy-6-metoxy-1,4-benzoquinol methylase
MPTPHDTWAPAYEPIYRETFGPLYDNLTQITLAMIRETSPPPATIIDFGAGTGRLAVPLSQEGYSVTVVESSSGMLNEMKIADPDSAISKHHCLIQDFKEGGDFDLALCVFTVILYLLDEVSLRQGLENVFTSLRPNGRLFLDIPTQAAFRTYRKKTPRMSRHVSVEPIGGELFQYTEQTRFDEVDYYDTFQIRYWKEEYILGLLGEIGFTLELDLRNRFAGTGSSYFIFKRQ